MTQSELTIQKTDKNIVGHEVTDEALMITYAEGDASAFEQLYQRHKRVIFHFFIKQGLSTAIAEELCHDTWLKLINARKNYQVSAQFRTYLFTIARNTLIDHKNKKSNQKEETHADLTETPIALNNTDLSNQQRQLAQALTANIAALPIEQREVFLLKQESGFSIEQIAKITAQHKEKVKSSWRYALQRLRKGLSDYVI
ncbi:RNA polymerase subunit sigma [Colwellia sp. 75C3]|uniref:sigma-70 family RNA polymerase sigma factor n=1 Tax=Colwellia sp. 75C3 TaxID=888425 RepID=UPI000C346058|nr:sigma-70 family RNA polymerase sigma factor [Colwellia sp. 75C3]PKG84216.1 RNA polymerase subunit sigma [Colwellia sp. 75C3]